ncbi:MAG: A/G-specific adenine glycosylase [Alphaproteobacteria bacterium]
MTGKTRDLPEQTVGATMRAGHRRRLLAWYDKARRTLPWRAAAGDTPDPYRVWLSEVMLQQTTVATVVPYFKAFVARWPDVTALAAAPPDEVLRRWAGLGYYARARNLHRCAVHVATVCDGVFPSDESLLRRLPGIGVYSAAAIAAIAFDRPATVVDGNVERVVARLFRVSDPLPAAKPRLAVLAAALSPRRRSGDYAQAMMDLGATVCRPRNPDCPACPLARQCLAYRDGVAGTLPRRAPRAVRPLRHGHVYWLEDSDGRILLRRRPASGLLGGLLAFPGGDWRPGHEAADDTLPTGLPRRVRWRRLPGQVEHVFTHFRLSLTVSVGGLTATGSPTSPAGDWWPADRLDEAGLPSLMMKVAAHVAAAGAV